MDLEVVAAQYLKSKIGDSITPRVGIICGSGLSGIAAVISNHDAKVTIPYSELIGFPTSTVPGHFGRLVCGRIGSLDVICLQGRVHYYENKPLSQIVTPVKVLAHMGVEVLIITNAAGSLRSNFSVSDLMLIKDHIFMPGLGGISPILSKDFCEKGSKTGTRSCYDIELRQKFKDAAKKVDGGSGTKIHEGLYAMVGGPSYETPSEASFLCAMGADAVGMSTVPEAIIAHQLGMRVLAISLLTNQVRKKSCYSQENEIAEVTSHEEVLKASNQNIRLQQIIIQLIQDIFP